MGRHPGGHWQGYIISSYGGVAEPAYSDAVEQGIPTWSPDGRFLVYGERRDQRPAEQMKLHLVDLSTRRMTDLPSSAAKWTARWSPNGRYILAQSLDWHDLYLFDVTERQWHHVGRFGDADQLLWSQDSRYVYFQDVTQKGALLLHRLKIGGGSEKVLDLSAVANGDLTLIGAMPDGSPVLSHSIATQEIYSLEMKWP